MFRIPLTVLFFGVLSISCNSHAAKADSEKSVYKSRSDSCPNGAMKNNGILWDNIRSDQAAINCLHLLALRLGPERTKEYLNKKGFSAKFLRKISEGKDRTLLSATWPIKTSGPLYQVQWPKRIFINRLAYGQTFSLFWDTRGNVTISQAYTFE